MITIYDQVHKISPASFGYIFFDDIS